MDQLPGMAVTDPIGFRALLAKPWGRGHKTILGLGPFQDDIGPVLLVLAEKTPMVFPAGRLLNAHGDLGPCSQEFGNTPARHHFMGIPEPYVYFGDPVFQD